ncbi:hypothetical protein [Hyphomicrobium sulfonivorans]|uniref:hypothetical protein n=1 Tax=Hyphomicrobium sulfonivorans TaxID=121290 RepID=UPI000A5774AA|nr:hypothetical protein [Hyphomicrobium sulfonivorans]
MSVKRGAKLNEQRAHGWRALVAEAGAYIVAWWVVFFVVALATAPLWLAVLLLWAMM